MSDDMHRLDPVEPVKPQDNEELYEGYNRLKEEMMSERQIVRSTIARADKLALQLESQKKELESTKATIAKQELEIAKLNEKLFHQNKTKDETSVRPTSPPVLPRSKSFEIKQVIKKDEATKPRSGSDLTRFASSLFLFKNVLNTSPHGSAIVAKSEKEISPRVNFANISPRTEVSPGKGKEIVDEKKEEIKFSHKGPLTKNEIYRSFSQTKGTGPSGKTLNKSPEYYYEHALIKTNTFKILKRN